MALSNERYPNEKAAHGTACTCGGRGMIHEKSCLQYTVGLTDGSGTRKRFRTEEEASAYIETLPDYKDGRYYLDGPNA